MHSTQTVARGQLEPGDLVAGKYRVEQLLGEGAMGSVWAVTNELTERRFALKLVVPAGSADPELRARLLREARAAGRIVHRNVVEVYDVGETEEGAPFLVMQLLSGETLEQRLIRDVMLPPAEALRIAADIARGLVAAHTAGVVHRDLKPANVFLHVDSDGAVWVKVVDFGVSKVLSAGDATGSVTGLAIGSPAYMSPEQARGERALDQRTDVWALGVVLFEMLSGCRPFQGDTQYDTVAEILKGPIPRLSERVASVDESVEHLVARCLQRRRDDRPASAREVLEALTSLLEPDRVPRASLPDLAPGGLNDLCEDTVPIAAPSASVSTVSPATVSARQMLHTRPAARSGSRIPFAAAAALAVVVTVVGSAFLARAVIVPAGGGSTEAVTSTTLATSAVSASEARATEPTSVPSAATAPPPPMHVAGAKDPPQQRAPARSRKIETKAGRKSSKPTTTATSLPKAPSSKGELRVPDNPG